jgi:Protein of unknown function (DUF3168)
MSYAGSAALQAAIFQRLATDPALAGVPVVDALPKGGGKGTFILLGPEEALDRSDQTGGGAEHRLTVSVITDAEGFAAAKAVAVKVSDRLVGASLSLSRGALVALHFRRAVARRLEAGEARRIDMEFRARVAL